MRVRRPAAWSGMACVLGEDARGSLGVGVHLPPVRGAVSSVQWGGTPKVTALALLLDRALGLSFPREKDVLG